MVAVELPAAPAAEERARPGRGGRWPVVAAALAVFAVYVAFSLTQWWKLRAASFDSVIFTQAVQGYAHLHAPYAAVKGVHDYGLPAYDELGDHFSPVWAVLAPLYRIWPSIVVLYAAQAALLAAAIVPIHAMARRRLGSAVAWAAVVTYALSFGVAFALQLDVHELAFAVPLLAVVIERVDAGRFASAAAAAVALCLVKEDLTLTAAAAGIVLVLKGARRLGSAVVLAGVAAFALETQVLIPHFAGGYGYQYAGEGLGALGPTIPAALHVAVTRPWRILTALVTPAEKWHTTVLTFAPWALLSWLSPYAVLAVPELAVRMLGTNYHWWGLNHQYSVVLMPIGVLAAVDTLARHRPTERRLRILVAAAAAVSVVAAAFLPLHLLLTSDQWTRDPTMQAADRALATIPSGVTVEADSTLGPHLVDRDTVWEVDDIPRWAPWVVMMVDQPTWPFTTTAQESERENLLLANGYRLVAHDRHWVVLHRG